MTDEEIAAIKRRKSLAEHTSETGECCAGYYLCSFVPLLDDALADIDALLAEVERLRVVEALLPKGTIRTITHPSQHKNAV